MDRHWISAYDQLDLWILFFVLGLGIRSRKSAERFGVEDPQHCRVGSLAVQYWNGSCFSCPKDRFHCHRWECGRIQKSIRKAPDMKINEDKIDDTVLALLSLTAHHDGFVTRAWKGHDWDVMDRLFQKGWIDDPKGKAKSVVFTEEGLKRSQELFRLMFEEE